MSDDTSSHVRVSHLYDELLCDSGAVYKCHDLLTYFEKAVNTVGSIDKILTIGLI